MQQERVGVAEEIGLRSRQEDAYIIEVNYAPDLKDGVSRSLFAVFDGHGGSFASTLAKEDFSKVLEQELITSSSEDALINTFLEMDKRIEETGFEFGCTAAVALIEERTLTVANVGDTRILLVNQEINTVERLTKDHTPDDPDEARRIVGLGGSIGLGRILAGGASVNISRSLGDKFAGELVSPEPTISKRELTPGKHWLVLECDGVWRGIADSDVLSAIAGKAPKEASKELVDRGDQSDNLTAIVIDIEVFE